MTNEDKAKSILKEVRGPLCDDCLTEKAHFSKRQTANAICRDLNNKSQIKRLRGLCSECKKFKIVNEYIEGRPSELAVDFQKKEKMKQAYRAWYWEGNIQSVLVNCLVKAGYTIRSVADTAARSQGKDIVTVDPDGRELWITVKGYPEKSSHTQARHWFSGALMSLILYRDENTSVSLGLALPNGFATYLNLTPRVEWLRRSMPFTIYWVSEVGEIRVE